MSALTIDRTEAPTQPQEVPAEAANEQRMLALANAALACEQKLGGLMEDLDAEWHALLKPKWAFLDQLSDDTARRQVTSRLFTSYLGGLPPLQRLLDPLARISLLSRPELLNRLCVLAIARRPGVLRCCIDKQARDAMRMALVDSFDPLMVMSRRGKPVHEAWAGWSPIIWACIGYVDWQDRCAEDDEVLRKLVRLSLPKRMLEGICAQPQVPAETSTFDALTTLTEMGVNWSC